jgi:hypothetical protein
MSGGPWLRFQRPATPVPYGQPVQSAPGASAPSNAQSRASAEVPRSNNALQPIDEARYPLPETPPPLIPPHDDWGQELAITAAEKAASESGLPSRIDGPGDAFRHLVWAAELTRRFGPRTASIILDLHERMGYLGSGMGYFGNGWSKEAEDMDRHNNAIGMRIGQAARDYNDVLQRAGSTMTATAPEGNGTWRDPHHSSPFPAPTWLPREKWRGMPSRQANWYDNPVRAQGLVFPKAWRHSKQYAFRAAEGKDGDAPSLGAILGLLRAQMP